MTNPERRALEVYTSLLIQYIRRNNSTAIKDIKNFFYSMSFRKTYDPELLYKTCIANIEVLEKIPSYMEIVLCTTIKSNNLKITKTTFKKYYPKIITDYTQRQAIFSGLNIDLSPKIDNYAFHQHLLTFYQEFGIIGKNIPVK